MLTNECGCPYGNCTCEPAPHVHDFSQAPYGYGICPCGISEPYFNSRAKRPVREDSREAWTLDAIAFIRRIAIPSGAVDARLELLDRARRLGLEPAKTKVTP